MNGALLRPHRRSETNTFNDCRHAYWLRKIKGKQGENEHTKNGIAKHLMFENILRGNVAPAGAENIAAWERVAPLVRGLTPEAMFYRDIDGNACEQTDALVQCQVDVYGSTHSCDYKMGQSGFDTDRYDDSFQFQADWYMATIQPDMRGLPRYSFAFLFPYQHMATDGVPKKTYGYTQEEIPPLWQWLKNTVLELEAAVADYDADNGNDWEPNYGSCKRCLHYVDCDLQKGVEAADGALMIWKGGLTKNNFPAAVKLLGQLEAMQKHVESALKSHVRDNGNVIIDGAEYGFYEKTTNGRTIPVRSFVSHLTALNVDKDEIYRRLALTQVAGQELLDLIPGNEEKIALYCVPEIKTQNKFGFKKEGLK